MAVKTAKLFIPLKEKGRICRGKLSILMERIELVFWIIQLESVHKVRRHY